MLKKVPEKKKQSKNEVFPEYGKMKDGFPSWVSPNDRKLLQAAVNETKFDLVVAKDGSGNFTTIGAAVAAAPNSSATRQVHYHHIITLSPHFPKVKNHKINSLYNIKKHNMRELFLVLALYIKWFDVLRSGIKFEV